MSSNIKIILAILAIIIVATIIVIYQSGDFVTFPSSDTPTTDSDANHNNGQPQTLESVQDDKNAPSDKLTNANKKQSSVLLPMRLLNLSSTTQFQNLNDDKSRQIENANQNDDFNDVSVPDDLAWTRWLDRYKPQYYKYGEDAAKQQESDRLELEKRKEIFLKNRNYIMAFNKQKSISFKLKLNHFGDLNTEEINAQYIGNILDKQQIFGNQHRSPPPVNKMAGINLGGNSPDEDSIDWSKKGVVYPAQNQGKCHSGQIHAIVAHMDSIYKIRGQPMRFSIQEVLDCLTNKDTKDPKKSVCEADLPMVDILSYLQLKGIHMNGDYPSLPDDGQCKLDKITDKNVADSIVKLQTYNMVHPNDINEALQNIGPLPVMLNASLRTFHFYSEGVYDDKDCSKQQYNHHALLIGYDAKRQAWILQNSFGQQWGQSGQILIKRTSDNLCGLEEGAIHVNL